GLAALALAAASALIETQIAAGSLSGASIHAFLLTNTAGMARVGLVVALALALSGAALAHRAAGLGAALALGALALSGHAHSASPRALAVAVEWLHLLAGAIWLGGIAVIALVWLVRLRGADRELRRAVAGGVLPRFALLVSFPTPGQILGARSLAAQPLVACSPCVLPLPAADQLAVAGYAGGDTVAAWLARDGGRLEGQVRVLDIEGRPATTPFEIEGAQGVTPSCGPGCRTFASPHAPASLSVILNPDRSERHINLPA